MSSKVITLYTGVAGLNQSWVVTQEFKPNADDKREMFVLWLAASPCTWVTHARPGYSIQAA